MGNKNKVNKKQVVYDAIIEGAKQGFTGEVLTKFVSNARSDASRKAISKAAFLALSDPNIQQKADLDAIYDLAIRFRFSEPTAQEVIDEQIAEPLAKVQKTKKSKKVVEPA